MTSIRKVTLAALALAAAALASATGAASQSAARSGLAPTPCAASALARADGAGSAERASALHSYDDGILDVVSAPDICQSNLVTNDNYVITVALHIHDRDGFAATDLYEIHLDTDQNAATGAPAGAGSIAGADYVIDIVDDSSRMRAWDGTAFTALSPQPEIPTVWLEGWGPILALERTALGDPQALGIVVRTGAGTDVDLAPDTGSWTYLVTPLRLESGAVKITQTGRQLGAAMEVTRSDFDIALDEGAISCKAAVAGRKLAGRGRFRGDFVTCSWRLPRDARGKRVRGSIAVEFQGVTAKRSFVATVR